MSHFPCPAICCSMLACCRMLFFPVAPCHANQCCPSIKIPCLKIQFPMLLCVLFVSFCFFFLFFLLALLNLLLISPHLRCFPSINS
ncbi:hypothetical protein V8C44DRAFT_336860 [Trichoderma aethiopicum]